jgi:hypothetical protein
VVEHGVDRRSAHPIDGHQGSLLPDGGARPHSDVGVWAERRIGHLQDDAEDVLVDEEVVSGELEVVEEP